jgi:hypothetical protein
LAWRCPPRFKRCRVVVPDDVGIGAAPAELRPGSLGADPLWVVAGHDQHLGRGVGSDAERLEQLRCDLVDQLFQEFLMVPDLGMQLTPAPRE